VHPFMPGITGRQNQYRHVTPGTTPAAEHIKTGLLRQAQVQNDGIEGLFHAQKLAIDTVGSGLDGVTGLFEVGLEPTCQLDIILYQQYLHAQSSISSLSTAPVTGSSSNSLTTPSLPRISIS